MAMIDKLSIALSTETSSLLRKAWLEAVADDSEGVDPDLVFDRFEKKYESLAEATGR